MSKIKKVIKSNEFIAFSLSFILGFSITILPIIFGKGAYTLLVDFNYQQIPFNMMINDSIKEGSILWTWFNDLGSNFISSFSFYNLFSPFNIIGYLFPASWFKYLIGPIFMLKYGVAGLTSYLFLKRYVKNKKHAILGSVLYSFSGFQLTSMMYYHFHDVVAFFPLLLYALDNLIYDNKKYRFVYIVALLAFTNWFFFIGEVVFVIIYFIIKVITKEYKITWKKFGEIFLEGLLGTLIACIVLIPSALFTLENPRVYISWDLYNSLIYTQKKDYLSILKALIFPPELMTNRAIIYQKNYAGCETYLPFVGLIFSLSYLVKEKKNWLSVLFMTLIIFMFVPILNNTFYLFNPTYYSRWFFSFTLISSLMTIKCIDDNISVKNGMIINFLLYIFFILLLLVLKIRHENIELLFNIKYLFICLLYVFSSNIILFLIINLKSKKLRFDFLFISVILSVVFFGNLITYMYKGNTFKTNENLGDYYYKNDAFEKYKNYRFNSSDSILLNYGYINRINNIKSFNSNVNGSAFSFYKSIGFNRAVITDISIENLELNNLLGVKYILAKDIDNPCKFGYKLKEKFKDYNIYYNPSAKDIGYTVNNVIKSDEFEKLDFDNRINILNDTIVLNDQNYKLYNRLYDNKNQKLISNNFEFIKNGFKSNVNSNSDSLLIYQIPYDKGWKAYINGQKTDFINVNNGFIAIKINKGDNIVEFKYFPPGLKLGIIISTISLIITFILNYKENILKKGNNNI